MSEEFGKSVTGLSSLCYCADKLADRACVSEARRGVIKAAYINLQALLDDNDAKEDAIALACSVLNTMYRKSGWRFMLNGQHDLVVNSDLNHEVVTALADSLGL